MDELKLKLKNQLEFDLVELFEDERLVFKGEVKKMEIKLEKSKDYLLRAQFKDNSNQKAVFLIEEVDNLIVKHFFDGYELLL